MQCPECQFDNREGAKFCKKCGEKLELKCPSCGSGLDGDSIFCDECGHNLSKPPESIPQELSFDEKLKKIQKYLPKGLTDKILSQRDKIEGERKNVTIMFADMVGFAPLVEKIGPEEAYSIMDQVYEILIHKVREYDGTVNEMTGDGIMALFGAPIALEDSSQRAIRSAYDIHREVSIYNERLKKRKGSIPSIKMRIGIHSGPVVVGSLGNDLRVEFKAVGETVNIASRLEGLAEPGTTYVSEMLFKLAEGFFRFEALGKKEIKGKDTSIKVYQVIAPSTRRTRFDVSAERGLTPFIGRERELEFLLDGFNRVKTGNGQAISIMGEAGVGKSRLLYEFRKAIDNEDRFFLEGKCLSYSKDVAYHPITDILLSNFDIHDDDNDISKREKVIDGLKILGEEGLISLPYFLELLYIKNSGIDQVQLSPEGRKNKIVETLKRITFKGSEIRPLILVIEDLHWIDKTSEDVLGFLLEDIIGSRIYLIFTYRPEYVPTWGAKTYHNQVILNRLSNRESIGMVSNLLDSKDVSQDLQELILKKSEGVPFYIEELIKSLRDLEIIEQKDNRFHLSKNIQEVAIPSTIHDVIMSRVDSLTDNLKELLQTCATIGREFNYELIKEIMKVSEEELLSNLSVLKDLELIYERGIFPKSTYIFKHALTQEVIYESILKKTRNKLHENIGKAIEKLYKEDIEENYDILAEHFSKSENAHKSDYYFSLAGRKAERTGSISTSITYVNKRIQLLEKVGQTEDIQDKLINSRIELGIYYIQLGHYFKAKEVIDPIISLVQSHGDSKLLCRIHLLIGYYNWFVKEDFNEASKNFSTVLSIAEEIDDRISLVMANILLNTSKALEMNIAAGYKYGIAAMKSILIFHLLSSNNLNEADKISKEAISLAEESDDIFSKGKAYVARGQFMFFKGFIDESEKHLLKGTEICERNNDIIYNIWGNNLLGRLYLFSGDYVKSESYLTKAILLSEKEKILPSLVIRQCH